MSERALDEPFSFLYNVKKEISMSTHNEAVEDIKKAKSVLDAQPAPISKKFFTHTSVSMIKSGFRIAAGLALAGGGWLEMNPYIQAAGLLLVVAEVLGIAEELV
jgi:hypothetical protein